MVILLAALILVGQIKASYVDGKWRVGKESISAQKVKEKAEVFTQKVEDANKK
jgi:hypothetical protein